MKMSSVCVQLVVVAVTLLLSDVTCQTVHNINVSDDVHSVRQRRQAEPLTQDLISAIVDRHNVLRALEGAANMELMIWNKDQASQAATWAAQCVKGHNRGGQNVYWGYGNINTTLEAIDLFYGEKQYYNLDSNTCDSSTPGCRHYTQVVWASSRHIGCAVHRCPHNLMVCNYSPTGNRGSRRPYTKGPWCSKCGNGAGWCKNKLCNSQCSSAGEGCSCAAICYNCAELNLETCLCKCAEGWRGVDCTQREKGNPNAEEGLCPPVRGPAADSSAQTIFIRSHQSTMIFVIIVITFTINSYDAL